MNQNKENTVSSINQFFDYFINQVDRIENIVLKNDGDDKLHVQKQTLLVSLIDSLSNTRFNKKDYPQLSNRNRVRFVRFLEQYSSWEEGSLVSLPFLRDYLKQIQNKGQLFEYINSKISEFELKGNLLLATKMDISVTDLNSLSVNEKEEEAILYFQHYSILYRYRNYLVHESRKPGYAMQFMSYETSAARYHSYLNDPILHLLYPTEMLMKIVMDSSNNLRKYFIEKLLDPYTFVENTLRF